MPNAQKNKIDLSELRIKIDQMNEQIISGLKQRSRYPLNKGVFTKEFIANENEKPLNKNTWFLFRLRKEQDIDAQFGRFIYSDQAPMFFKKEELATPLRERKAPKIEGLVNIPIDKSKEILKVYQEILTKICIKKEDEDSYGETVKLDVSNVLAINERVLGLGEMVAEYKIESNPKIINETNKSKIKEMLVVLKREQEVVQSAKEIALKYGLTQTEDIGNFMQKIIDITTDTEIEYILKKNVKK
jgi:chorismate mutase